MANGYLRTVAIGNLGKDAERRNLDWGTVVNFSIGCNETWQNKDGSQGEHCEWVSCQLTGKRAVALAQYLTRGSRVMVEGTPRTRKYEDKDGVTRYATDLRVRELVLLGGNRDGGGDRPAQRDDDYAPSGGSGDDFDDSDIPF